MACEIHGHPAEDMKASTVKLDDIFDPNVLFHKLLPDVQQRVTSLAALMSGDHQHKLNAIDQLPKPKIEIVVPQTDPAKDLGRQMGAVVREHQQQLKGKGLRR